MNNEKIIQTIDEYLEEPHSIHPDWVEALQICRQALIDNETLKAEIKIMLRKKETLRDEISELQADNEKLREENKYLKDCLNTVYHLVQEMVGEE